MSRSDQRELDTAKDNVGWEVIGNHRDLVNTVICFITLKFYQSIIRKSKRNYI